MTPSVVVNGVEIVNFVAAHPQGLRLSQLAKAFTQRYGPSTKFAFGSLLNLDLDELLVFLEARDKMMVVREMVFPANSPVRSH